MSQPEHQLDHCLFLQNRKFFVVAFGCFRFLHEEFLKKLNDELAEKECDFEEALARVHAGIAIGKAFYNVGRGRGAHEEETENLQEILDWKLYKMMNVKKETLEESIQMTDVAYNDFFDYTYDVVEELKNAVRENRPVPLSLLEEWSSTFEHLVTEIHTRHADYHELAMMRCFGFLANPCGLSNFSICEFGENRLKL